MAIHASKRGSATSSELGQTPGSPLGFRYRLAGLSVLLLLMVGLAYMPSLRNDFVNYDDNDYVTENTEVQKGLHWSGIQWAFSKFAAANWHPLTWMSHMLDCQIYGLNPWGHHLTNLLFHAANTVLIFWVLGMMTQGWWKSLFVAGFFAVHPLHVESVAWVSERKDVLSTFFFFFTIWAYVLYAARNLRLRSERIFYGLALAFFALGLLSKPMLVTVPFVLLILDYWPLQRKTTWQYLVWEKLPFFILSAVICIVTFSVQKRAGALWNIESLPLTLRFENALVSYVRYLGSVFWPTRLAVFYPHPGAWPVIAWVGSALLVGAITVAVLYERRRRPYLLTGWFWFMGTLIPVIGIVQVGWQSMADRYMYIPLIGLSIMVVWEAEAWVQKWRQERWEAGVVPVCALGAGLVLVCGIITREQVAYWHNSETLFRRAIEVTTRNWVARHNLGMALLAQQRYGEALVQFSEAVKMRPNAPNSYNGAGEALLGEGQVEDAIRMFHRALELKPDLAVAHNNLGLSLTRKHLLVEAQKEFESAIDARRGYAKAYSNLGMNLQAQGKLDHALPAFREAVRLAPEDAELHKNLAMALGRSGQLDEAITELRQALRLNPNDSQLHHNLGLALSRQELLEQAVQEFRVALKLKSDSLETHMLLGATLAKMGRREDAAIEFKEVLSIRPNYAPAEEQLKQLGQL